MRVLIADDHSAVRSAICLVLKEELVKAVIAQAANLGELFTLAFSQQPDLVLLDWELSGFPSAAPLAPSADDPSQRRREIRRNVVILSLHKLSSHPVVIVLSSDPEARQAALEGGADAFVLKGGPPQELFQALQSLRKRGRLRKNP